MAMHDPLVNEEMPAIELMVAPEIVQDSLFFNRLKCIFADSPVQLVSQFKAVVGLIFDENGLALRNTEQPKSGDVRVDFLSPALAYRKAKGGGRNELLAKAIGIKGNEVYRVIDATAGLGGDAFVLASVGCDVTMMERSPIVAGLLQDALIRLENQDPNNWLLSRLILQKGHSVALMEGWLNSHQQKPEAIYLDPMFPHRKKSALVKKEMQALQALLGVDPDADKLLPIARQLAGKRVVVKRPAAAPFLNDSKPELSMKSKKHRFDIYLS